MIVENKRRIIVLQLLRLASIVLLAIFVVLVLYDVFDYRLSVPGLSKTNLILFIVLAYLAFYSWPLLCAHGYFYFSDMGTRLIFRYYSLIPFVSKQEAVQIKKDDFVKFEIKQTFFGLRKYLIIYQRVGNKIAKYAPISISRLQKTQIDDLSVILQSYQPK